MGKGRAPTSFDYYIMYLNEKKRKKYKRCSYAEYQAKVKEVRSQYSTMTIDGKIYHFG